jgi:hypothetical protein
MKSSLEMTEHDAAKLTAEPNDCSARFVLQIKEEWESGVLIDRNKKKSKGNCRHIVVKLIIF